MTDVLGPIPSTGDGQVEASTTGSRHGAHRAWSSTTRATTLTTRTSEWNQVIRRLHESLPTGLAGQLDFSATPRYAKGGLFTWTIYDYPLKQAIIDNVVKRPMKGMTAGIKDQPSDVASVKYQGIPHGRRRALARVPRPAQAARQEAGSLRHAQQHGRGGRRR